MDDNDLVAYYDDYYRCWYSGFRGWCKKNGHKQLILVQPASWIKENLTRGAKTPNKLINLTRANEGTCAKL